ncbi:agmatinase [Thermosulfidibacter takaii ABI70S6]|uniref:Agmatinase n=1 Tax=Thermosulfidibacter takaii (strain DSM 17441 / JCM 13301 / NBRC 103674 / ABI70S6) TaxID=1298851 RepID=A0A0S3QSR4_THET7|nr:agmatinase [Thermosulfidibacter takaii]BAT71340.1 agmatinase [Thermosulfidibacter takaii ABI70S6]
MRFLGTKSDGDVVLFGVPFDETVSYKPGTRFAPVEIRKVSDAIETYSPYLDLDIEECPIGDVGDMELPLGNRELSLRMIEEKIDDLLAKGKRVLSIGGEHLITYALIKAYKRYYENLVLVQLDAHTDSRDTYLGEKLSHATTVRRIYELGIDVCQIGVRSGLREEFVFARENYMLHHPFNLNIDLRGIVGGRPVYITLDIDVLDPSVCQGLGTPEPGGVTYRELVGFLSKLKGVNIVGADLVELSPLWDPTGNSAVVGASLVRELSLLLAFSCR